MVKQFNALGAYIFAGGFTLGVREHFKVHAHFEDGLYGVESARAGLGIPVYTDAEQWPWRDYVGKIDLLYGNPPCAAWSSMGKNSEAWRSDARVDCARSHMNLMELIRPKVWVWESVVPVFKKGRPFVDEMTERALAMGYSVDYVLHNARYLGALQRRQRFFMVCTKIDIDWKCDFIDAPNCGPELKKLEKTMPFKKQEKNIYATSLNLQQRFLDAAEPGAALRILREKMTEGMTEEEAREKVGIRLSFGSKKLRPNEVSIAMVHPAVMHPDKPRFLSITEIKLLGGWPLDYPLIERGSENVRQLMRAVLPPVGKWLAENVKRALLRNKASQNRVRVVDYLSPPGSIEILRAG